MRTPRRVPSDELSPDEVTALRELLWKAWSGGPEGFTDDDWLHAVGGMHFFLQEADTILAHASVVQRELHTGGHRLATGYVEAVATEAAHRRRGHGTAIMRAVVDYIDRTSRLGALSTGAFVFFEPLGWLAWEGPTFVRTESGLLRTAAEDGSLLVRLTPTSPRIDPAAPISCDWRAGDVW